MRLDRSLSAALASPVEALSELDRLGCEESLAKFFRRAWHQVGPGGISSMAGIVRLSPSISKQSADGRILRLLINISPGTMEVARPLGCSTQLNMHLDYLS